MRILRGKYAGRTARAHQYANDWITADIDGGPQGLVLRPTMVQLVDGEDFAKFSVTDPRHVGGFWREWRLNDDGTFTALSKQRRVSA